MKQDFRPPFRHPIFKRLETYKIDFGHVYESTRFIGYESEKRNLAWLELDNGFVFFVDRGMFEKFCALFGVAT